MKTAKGLIMIVLAVVFLVSCAGGSRIPFKTMLEQADSWVGEPVILGGYILESHM
ncbi:MAG: hypothetical protein JRE65_03265, partial [Deltaproteobacteria bacterium]|nr:hypothetical protein [Deltaproteobacteria bacterium]